MTNQSGGDPAFDPQTALGWRDVGLDGLSCYLRCVEAVLAHHGRSPREIALSLAAPLNLICRDFEGQGPFGDFPGCRVEWQETPDGLRWADLEQAIADDRHLVVSPDGYCWPGDEFEGQQSAHHHMVLPVRIGPEDIDVLDTDAPAEDGFTRLLPLDEKVRASFDRWAPVTLRPVPTQASAVTKLLTGSVERLAEDLREMSGFRAHWQEQPLPEFLARGLHVYVLGDVQPQLFTVAQVLAFDGRPELGDLVVALSAAARRAKKVGILLTGLHRFRSRQVYDMCLEEFEALEVALRAVLQALADRTGEPVPELHPVAPLRLAARLAAVTEWSFGQPADQTLQWIVATQPAR